MSEDNIQTARKMYSSFNAGDIPAVLESMDAGIEWTEPGGGNSASGTFKGPDAVAQQVFAIVPENFDEFAVNPEQFSDEGDEVIVTGRFKGKNKSGSELDSAFEHRMAFSGGKVSRFDAKMDENWAAGWS
jgi:ketosteroid isomerase-like protein